MNKIEIEVPINVRYISEWDDFDNSLFFQHSIINKTITGCGFTHYCLTNKIPTILCSPRKFLLENKHIQLPNTYLVINSGEKGIFIDNEEIIKVVDPIKELFNKKTKEETETLENYSEILTLQENLRSYILHCQLANITPKILVTYDSLKHILGVIGDLIQYYSIIVDEFQNIFMDASFKADTELNFINSLQDCPNVTYLSATPYIEEYLNELDEFKDLPYYELKWYPDRLQTIKVDMRKTYHISKDIDKIVQDYLNGRFPEKVDENGIAHQSKEVVFYVNSVKMISSTILRNNLTSENTNIICADTEKNKKVLDKIGFSIGKAPLKGQSHKMFTFCTRTTYAGSDFYSTSAMSIIISDCKINSLSTDIRMDFPQIMGRQRLKENVFRDECIFIYKLSDSSVTMEEFDRMSKEKIRITMDDIKNGELLSTSLSKDNLINDIRLRIQVKKYKNDYTGIDEKTGLPKLNKLVLIAERRAFELRSDIYKTDVMIYNEFNNIQSVGISFEDLLEKNKIIDHVRRSFNSSGSFESKMRVICDLLLDPKWFGKIHISDLFWLPLSYRNYLNYLGPEKIKSKAYYEAEIKREIQNLGNEDMLRALFINSFAIGEKLFLKDVKERIRKIYKDQNLQRTPKAVDLLNYFEVREYMSVNKETGKRLSGYEILKIKE